MLRREALSKKSDEEERESGRHEAGGCCPQCGKRESFLIMSTRAAVSYPFASHPCCCFLPICFIIKTRYCCTVCCRRSVLYYWLYLFLFICIFISFSFLQVTRVFFLVKDRNKLPEVD
ncbi:hypothetical protein GQ457_07G041910 [Hibiscus cannabinus]